MQEEILIRNLAGGKHIISKTVGDHAVDFLGHAEVPAANACFHVAHFSVEFLGYDGACHGASHVAYYEYQVCGVSHQVFLEGHHDVGSLLGLCAAATTEIGIGHRYAEFLEEGIGHILVVVLTSVNKAVMDILASCVSGLYGFDERRNLHEVRACACDKGD